MGTTTTTRTTDSFDSNSDASMTEEDNTDDIEAARIPVSKDDGDDYAQLKELIDYDDEDNNNNEDIIGATTTTTSESSMIEEEKEKEAEKGKKEKVANKWP